MVEQQATTVPVILGNGARRIFLEIGSAESVDFQLIDPSRNIASAPKVSTSTVYLSHGIAPPSFAILSWQSLSNYVRFVYRSMCYFFVTSV